MSPDPLSSSSVLTLGTVLPVLHPRLMAMQRDCLTGGAEAEVSLEGLLIEDQTQGARGLLNPDLSARLGASLPTASLPMCDSEFPCNSEGAG